MEILNRYFAPFAAFLVLSAIYFSKPDAHTTWLSLGMLAFAIAANLWISRRAYRYIAWTKYLRGGLVWINYLLCIPLVYLLGGWWGPMWLLFLMAPATAALHGKWIETVSVAVASAATLLAIYWFRGLEGDFAWGQAGVHAVFIVFFSLFVHALAEAVVRFRDAAFGRS
jgi:hypothetical protein